MKQKTRGYYVWKRFNPADVIGTNKFPYSIWWRQFVSTTTIFGYEKIEFLGTASCKVFETLEEAESATKEYIDIWTSLGYKIREYEP